MCFTQLDQKKLQTFSEVASYIVKNWESYQDQRIAHEMLREGLRKLHDHATSHRGSGKFLGHSDWSKKALEILSNANGDVNECKGSLRHEHVVPVSVVVDLLVALSPEVTPKKCEDLIQNFSIVAIITRVEDRKLSGAGLARNMPANWDRADVWARYEEAGLKGDITVE